MNFSFQTPDGHACNGRLWASGRYGFSLPKKVEILAPDGAIHTYLYFNTRLRENGELANRAIVRIAIAQFLRGEGGPGAAVELDAAVTPFGGALGPAQPALPRTPLRVRPGKSHARPALACDPG